MTGGTAAEVDELSVFNRRQAVGIGWLENMLNNYVAFASQILGNTRKMILGQGGRGRTGELSLREPILHFSSNCSFQFNFPLIMQIICEHKASELLPARSLLTLEWIIKVTLTWAKIMLKDFETLHVGIDVKAAPDWLLAGWLARSATDVDLWSFEGSREKDRKRIPRVMKSTFCLFYVRNFTLTEIFP